jgi:hypothetical protein
VDFAEEHSMLTNIGLWIILAGMIAIVPIGCYMTRPRKKGGDLTPGTKT